MSRFRGYVADLNNKFERVEVHGRCADLFRFGHHVTTFTITAGQAKKVKRGEGKIRITEKAITRGHDLCRRWSV